MNANNALAVAMIQAGIIDTQEIAQQAAIKAASLGVVTGEGADRRTDYIVQGIIFVGETLASIYARKKLALIAPSKGSAVTEEAVEECREAARLFNSWRSITGLDIDSQRVADFICGQSVS